MDEKLKIPSSSCETPLHVLYSPESIPGICEQTECLAISSTSVIEKIPITNLKRMPNIKAKETVKMVKMEISIPSASDKNLDDDLKSISQTVNLLRAAEKECNQRIYLIKSEFQMLTDYLKKSTSSTKELVDKLKSPTAYKELADAEKKTKRHLFLIKEALISITNRLNFSPSDIRELKKALKSLTKRIKKIDPKQDKHKDMLTQIKESLEKELDLPFRGNTKVAREIRFLIHFIDLSIDEITEKIIVLPYIQMSLISINYKFAQFNKIELSESESSGDSD